MLVTAGPDLLPKSGAEPAPTLVRLFPVCGRLVRSRSDSCGPGRPLRACAAGRRRSEQSQDAIAEFPPAYAALVEVSTPDHGGGSLYHASMFGSSTGVVSVYKPSA